MLGDKNGARNQANQNKSKMKMKIEIPDYFSDEQGALLRHKALHFNRVKSGTRFIIKKRFEQM